MLGLVGFSGSEVFLRLGLRRKGFSSLVSFFGKLDMGFRNLIVG